MKIELDIPDLEEVIYSYCEEDSINGRDIKEALFNIILEKIINKMYTSYIQGLGFKTIQINVENLIKEKQEEIIEAVINKVSEKILLKKQIVSEIPKKSEIVGINKEWEDYFVELVDKAIARRFK